MPIAAGGRWVPAPGVSYAPRPVKISERLAANLAELPAPPSKPTGATLQVFGTAYALPARAEVKFNERAAVAWIRSAGVVVTITPNGVETVTAEEHDALIEGWALLP